MAVTVFLFAILCCVWNVQGTPFMCLSHYTGSYQILGAKYSEGCRSCVCEYSGPKCDSTMCVGKREEKRAATLMKCQSFGKTYNIGQMYSEGCDLCRCEPTGPDCHKGLLCTLGRRRDADLVPMHAPVCTVDGRIYTVGQTMTLDCVLCTCTGSAWSCMGTAECLQA